MYLWVNQWIDVYIKLKSINLDWLRLGMLKNENE